MEWLAFHHQRRQALMPHDLQIIPAGSDNGGENILRLRCRTHVDLGSHQPEHGLGPCPAALPVRNHLTLINDGNIVDLLHIGHLNGGRLNTGERDLDLLLSGQKRTGKAFLVQSLKLFICQQPQGCQIRRFPALSGHFPHALHGVMRLG